MKDSIGLRGDALLWLEQVYREAIQYADKLDPRRRAEDHVVRALDSIISASSHALFVDKALREREDKP